jgi:hypothetical protein
MGDATKAPCPSTNYSGKTEATASVSLPTASCQQGTQTTNKSIAANEEEPHGLLNLLANEMFSSLKKDGGVSRDDASKPFHDGSSKTSGSSSMSNVDVAAISDIVLNSFEADSADVGDRELHKMLGEVLVGPKPPTRASSIRSCADSRTNSTRSGSTESELGGRKAITRASSIRSITDYRTNRKRSDLFESGLEGRSTHSARSGPTESGLGGRKAITRARSASIADYTTNRKRSDLFESGLEGPSTHSTRSGSTESGLGGRKAITRASSASITDYRTNRNRSDFSESGLEGRSTHSARSGSTESGLGGRKAVTRASSASITDCSTNRNRSDFFESELEGRKSITRTSSIRSFSYTRTHNTRSGSTESGLEGPKPPTRRSSVGSFSYTRKHNTRSGSTESGLEGPKPPTRRSSVGSFSYTRKHNTRSGSTESGLSGLSMNEKGSSNATADIWPPDFWNGEAEENCAHAHSYMSAGMGDGLASPMHPAVGDFLKGAKEVSDESSDEDDDSVLSDISGLTGVFSDFPEGRRPDKQTQSSSIKMKHELGTVPHSIVVSKSKPKPTNPVVSHSLRFGKVVVRNYERILSDNPAGTKGPSIGLGWEFVEQHYDIEDWEMERGSLREPSELLLNRHQREELLRDLGYTKRDIATAVQDGNKIKSQRQQTINNLEASERLRRTLRPGRPERPTTSPQA